MPPADGRATLRREPVVTVLVGNLGDVAVEAHLQNVPGGPSSTLGTYSTSWI